ncbi:hypothetical protein JMJ77_0008907, partial [Colletotrichum scovillei]
MRTQSPLDDWTTPFNATCRAVVMEVGTNRLKTWRDLARLSPHRPYKE